MYNRLFFLTILASSIILASHFCTAAVFECALWPEEYRPRPLAKTELSIYKSPSFESIVIEGEKIHKGQEIDFDQTIYRTIKPGQAKVITSLTIDGTSYGNIEYLSKDDYYYKGYSKTIELNSGETIEYLQKRAEGDGLVKIDGEIIAFDILVLASSKNKQIKITNEPTIEWWIRVIDKKEQPIGWVLIDKETVDW